MGSHESSHTALGSYRHSWNSLHKSLFNFREALEDVAVTVGQKRGSNLSVQEQIGREGWTVCGKPVKRGIISSSRELLNLTE